MRPDTPRPASSAAFSLVEIILAIGVISFAIVAILGMFPVAVRSAAESQQETQAALIARGIFQELAAQTGPTRYFTADEKLDGGKQVKINLATQSTEQDVAGFDADGRPIAAGGAATAYRLDAAVTPTTTPGLVQVTLTVKSNRNSYPFTTLLRP